MFEKILVPVDLADPAGTEQRIGAALAFSASSGSNILSTAPTSSWSSMALIGPIAGAETDSVR